MITEKQRESQRRYWGKNREILLAKARARTKVWAAKNPEKVRAHSNKWKKDHPEKAREQAKRFREAHKEELRIKSRNYVRIKRYGVTQKDVDTLIETQNGLCGMCGVKLTESNTQVDHDHQSGAVRGILCPQCNLCLGIFEKYRDLAEAYLARMAAR